MKRRASRRLVVPVEKSQSGNSEHLSMTERSAEDTKPARRITYGEMSEWLKVPLSKSGVWLKLHQEFESPPLRHEKRLWAGNLFSWLRIGVRRELGVREAGDGTPQTEIGRPTGSGCVRSLSVICRKFLSNPACDYTRVRQI